MKETTIFDDDFAEASIEAISLAALRTTSARSRRPTDEASFPTIPPAPRHRFRRAFSTLSPALPPPTRATPTLSDTHLLTTPPPTALKNTPYPSVWQSDLLALPHNALRAEISDLSYMLYPLPRHPAPLPHLRLIAAWAPPFLSFLSSYLAFENSVLHPWIFRPSPTPLRPRLAAHSAYLSDLAAELSNVLALFRARPSPEVAPLLHRAAAELTASAAQYLDVQARHLPSLIEQGHTRAEAANVARLMTRRLDVLLLTRWMPRRKDRVSVKRMCLSPTRWVGVLARGRRECAEHLSIVEQAREIQYDNCG